MKWAYLEKFIILWRCCLPLYPCLPLGVLCSVRKQVGLDVGVRHAPTLGCGQSPRPHHTHREDVIFEPHRHLYLASDSIASLPSICAVYAAHTAHGVCPGVEDGDVTYWHLWLWVTVVLQVFFELWECILRFMITIILVTSTWEGFSSWKGSIFNKLVERACRLASHLCFLVWEFSASFFFAVNHTDTPAVCSKLRGRGSNINQDSLVTSLGSEWVGGAAIYVLCNGSSASGFHRCPLQPPSPPLLKPPASP